MSGCLDSGFFYSIVVARIGIIVDSPGSSVHHSILNIPPPNGKICPEKSGVIVGGEELEVVDGYSHRN